LVNLLLFVSAALIQRTVNMDSLLLRKQSRKWTTRKLMASHYTVVKPYQKKIARN
jgi:hypothetical protein